MMKTTLLFFLTRTGQGAGGRDARMSLRECEATLARYQKQNATCRNKLYADLAAPPPTHHHPLALVAAGVVLGALAVVAYRMMRTG